MFALIVGRSIGPDTCVTINSQGDIPAKRLRIIVPEDSQSNHLDLVDLSETAHKPNWKVKDILVAQKFRQYQEKALEEAKEHGLYMESHLQKILALSHILLLKPSQNDAEAVDIYGSDNLKEIQNAFTNQFFKASEIRLSSEDLKDGVKTRREATQKIHRMQVGADNFTYRILSLVANCIAKLRCHPFNETIGEMELITSILDPVLSPMLHDPDNDMIFKWTNTQVIETEVVNGSRPDSNFILYKESSGFCSLGFGEVKSEKHATDTALLAIDLTRIAVFSKHAIDKSNVNCVLGTSIVLYACKLQDHGIYVFGELVKIKVPDSLETLPGFISCLSDIYRVIHVYYTHCTPGQSSFDKRKTLPPPFFKVVFNQSRDKKRGCHVRFMYK
ncbi:hypothetical protein CLU79DRAFT_841232 [Phycomyces nitens]|nr:hypothetical protein CLU79DRAFT_841232 [Phycomyces nitens]